VTSCPSRMLYCYYVLLFSCFIRLSVLIIGRYYAGWSEMNCLYGRFARFLYHPKSSRFLKIKFISDRPVPKNADIIITVCAGGWIARTQQPQPHIIFVATTTQRLCVCTIFEKQTIRSHIYLSTLVRQLIVCRYTHLFTWIREIYADLHSVCFWV